MVPWHERESLRFQCVSLALSRSGALGLHRAPPDKEREEDSRQFTENCVMSNRIGDEGLAASVHSKTKGKVTVKANRRKRRVPWVLKGTGLLGSNGITAFKNETK